MNNDENPFSLGDLSKPATTLIEKISSAMGKIYEPIHIRRIAKAEADASKIRLLSDIEINDIQQRALERFIHEEARKQSNIESITNKALPLLNTNATPQAIETDWITYFFDHCRNVSDVEMQSIWSNLLSMEANEPGTYSKRAISLISTLDKADANLFTSICSFSVSTEDDPNYHIPLILNFEDAIYQKNDISFFKLTNLESIGLLRFDPSNNFTLQVPSNEDYFYYDNTKITITAPPDAKKSIDIGCIMLTSVGQQLSRICGARPDTDFLEYIQSYYRTKRYYISTEPTPPET
ncbi:DUF2806 domain-containing protein [Ectopseudomonas alcaliphila]|uniref:DUF2806 domain-containing protein n=1 Tax=Ectopseudomonas alcaliphila TaxID=101564 RepID=UPI00277F24FA|nr:MULTISPECIES: DUF2806 domain-containing protein [Pseudomonas]MDP9942141.1 hypothetical protein [Pseudomonas sp. 3400]MDR7014541.1 hypothetical protein [Pseudomonas alcaliphila]